MKDLALYAVTVIWGRKSHPEEEHANIVHVVAETADEACKAAVAHERKGFEKELRFCRMREVRVVSSIDILITE